MDLRKAYDSCEFWATELGCSSLGVPEEIVQFFKATEERMQTRIRTAHGLTDGCGTHMWDADVAGFGNRQPHLPNNEHNRPPQYTFLLS